MSRRCLSPDSRELAMVLHDLRQPLHSISLLNAALLRRVDEESALKMLQLQGESIDNLRSLIDELLDARERGGSSELPGG